MMLLLCVFDFFVFKQKTAYEMRISDWSSDVCSSDLDACLVAIGSVSRARRYRKKVPVGGLCAFFIANIENSQLPFISKDSAEYQGLIQQHADVSQEVTYRKVIGTVQYHITVFNELDGIFGRKRSNITADFNFRVQ